MQRSCARFGTRRPKLTEELGKSESWTSVPERKLFLYREDCSPDKQIQLTIKNEGNKAVCVYGGPAKDKRGKDDFLMYAETKRWEEMGKGSIWTHEGDDARKAQV
jgi:putative sterol carrier protein